MPWASGKRYQAIIIIEDRETETERDRDRETDEERPMWILLGQWPEVPGYNNRRD